VQAETVIAVHNVSKKFRLFTSSRERLLEALHPFRKRYHREFWALRDVSFEVRRGEVVGILGRNGSGKSTLLQIICAVMQATRGKVWVNGKISALLELGAGFNPEFTGRDNVMLNGAIMGIPHKEMARLLPEIEAFADIGEFFDQPVKTYSSGMFVRVAFAAAIHVNPDVLVVDEALSVGDARFQQKCLSQIEKIRANGTAILFVSHSLETITSICSRAVILEKGRMVADGEPKVITEQYLGFLFAEPGDEKKTGLVKQKSVRSDQSERNDWPGGDGLSFWDMSIDEGKINRRFGYNRHEVRTRNGSATIVDYLVFVDGKSENFRITSESSMRILVKVFFEESISQPIIGFELKTDKGVTITGSNSFMAKELLMDVGKDEVRIYQIEFRTPLNEDDYFIDLGITKYDGSPGGYVLDVRRSIIHFWVSRIESRQFNGIMDIGFGFSEVAHQP
jgi:lipopolysaccharide transport system ATP-binding protein